ncbi:MAG: hypothetical protein AAF236_01105 [Verrucomicrobiota bacterium]
MTARLCLTVLLVGGVTAVMSWAGSSGGRTVTEPLGVMTEPFATGLNFRTFNPPEGEKSDKALGEDLSLFEEFLEAQGVTRTWSQSDLEILTRLIGRDVMLASRRYEALDERYDVFDDEADDIEDALEDIEKEKYKKDDDDEIERAEDGKKKKKKKKDDGKKDDDDDGKKKDDDDDEKKEDDDDDEKKKDDDDDEKKKDDEDEVAPDLPRYLYLRRRAEPIRLDRNLLRDYLAMEEPVLHQLEAALACPDNEKLRFEACQNAANILYTLFSDQYLSEYPRVAGLERPRSEQLEIAKRFITRAKLNSTPYLDEASRYKRRLGRDSVHEARNLVERSSDDRPVTREELSRLTHLEVARLDVAPTNPWWFSHERMRCDPPNTWRMLESWLSRQVSAEELEKKSFEEDFPDFRYDLEEAQKILFWDDVKITATSPKVDTTDVFGQEWKLKWGEEAIVEPVANRLRLLLGAKFTDLVYADVGGCSHLLILPSEFEKSLNPDKQMPLTVSEFVEVMLKSKYQFNARPFILSSGRITEGNAESILRDLPEEAPKKYQPERLVGRTWIRFKESMVEARHDAYNRGGPVSAYTDFAAYDRGARLQKIVSIWLDETDVKEDNHRTVWMEDYDGKGAPQLIQYFHDSGSSIGGLRRTGEINVLTEKKGQGQFLWLSPMERQVQSNYFALYRPGFWDATTFADQYSGALHITRLSQSDIRGAVSHSKMPDFYQEVLSWRMIRRRDHVAAIYGLSLPDAPIDEKAPEHSVSLTTRADRSAAARRYQIPLSAIEDDLVRTGFLSSADRGGSTPDPFVDVLVKKGVIQEHQETVLLGILREYRHPPGFVSRMTRNEDDREYYPLRFQQEPPELSQEP